MKQMCTGKSPAKINVHLEVGARRPDGFHELCSLMVMADFTDTLTVSVDPHGEGFSITSYPIQLPQENTLLRAWSLFFQETGVKGSCSVSLEKRIPPGSGLAGGSGNAAALLVMLNSIYDFPLSQTALRDTASRIGSDVPFFLSSAACLVQGIGDVLTPLHAAPVYQVIVVMPSLEISTPWAYTMLDRQRCDPFHWEYRLSPERCFEAYLEGEPHAWPFFNSFEPVITGMHPCYADIRRVLTQEQEGYVVLTGSGSAMVGIYPELCDLKGMVNSLTEQQHGVVLTKTLAISPFEGYNVP